MSAPPARAYLVQCDGRGRCCARMKPSIGGDWVLYVAHRAEIESLERELARLCGPREPPHCPNCSCGMEQANAELAAMRGERDREHVMNLTQEQFDRDAHIPTNEIERDIRDTKAEIVTMRREIEGFRLLGDRWSDMRARARESGIQEREAFIAKLRSLLAARRASVSEGESL